MSLFGPNQAMQPTADRSQHVYELRPRKANHGVDLISDALPFGRSCYHEPGNSR
jgi:hypothetical protein